MLQSLFAPPRHLILLVIALWAGLTIAERRALRHGLSTDDLNSIVFYAMLAFILGGRLGFVLEHLPNFLRSPLDIFSISPSIFDPIAAAACAALAIAVHIRRRSLATWSTLDALVPVLAVLAVGLGLSHLAAETSYGEPTELPWAIQSRGALRHPSQVYEIISSLAILGLVLRRWAGSRPGALFLSFSALSAGAHLFVEAYRADGSFVLWGLRFGQLVAFGALIVFLLGFEYLDRREAKLP